MICRRALFLISTILLLGLFQNCSKPGIAISKILPPAVDETAVPSAEESPLPPAKESTPPPPDLVHDCKDAKDRGKIQNMKTEVTFEDPAQTCAWGKNGNLQQIEAVLTARTEQFKSITIPSGFTVCNIELSNRQQQNFRYDDNIILTMNQYIIASTTNFTRYLTDSNGYFKYDWSRLVGKGAQASAPDSTPDKQYCPGKTLGNASCLFPQTETVGKIELSFNERIIQNILSLTSPHKIELGMITTGDNNTTDCQHVPVVFSISIDYYQ